MEQPRRKTRSDPCPSFTATLGTAAIYIAPTWRGLYMQRAEDFPNNKSGTKYCMVEICQKKADLGDRLDYAQRTAIKAVVTVEPPR